MRRVIQKDRLGCSLAVCAMLFDLDEDKVPIIAPVQSRLGSKEHEEEAIKFVDDFRNLADKHGYSFLDFPPPDSPFTPTPGCRYLIVVGCDEPGYWHALAIDEHGTVFDPSKNKPDQVHLSDYDVKGIIELTPKS
jgi:hypothetical protein